MMQSFRLFGAPGQFAIGDTSSGLAAVFDHAPVKLDCEISLSIFDLQIRSHQPQEPVGLDAYRAPGVPSLPFTAWLQPSLNFGAKCFLEPTHDAAMSVRHCYREGVVTSVLGAARRQDNAAFAIKKPGCIGKVDRGMMVRDYLCLRMKQSLRKAIQLIPLKIGAAYSFVGHALALWNLQPVSGMQVTAPKAFHQRRDGNGKVGGSIRERQPVAFFSFWPALCDCSLYVFQPKIAADIRMGLGSTCDLARVCLQGSVAHEVPDDRLWNGKQYDGFGDRNPFLYHGCKFAVPTGVSL